MNILIVSATYLEVEPLLLKLNLKAEINQKLKNFTYQNHHIDVLIPGVGMTCTAFWLGKTLSEKSYDFALNVGIAGSFNEELGIGKVVNVKNDQLSELGTQDGEQFLSLIDMDLIMDEDFEFHDGLLQNNTSIDNKIIQQLPLAKAITVNTTHGNKDAINKTKQLFNPDIESMEGVAFFYACLIEKIPFAQIRCISNMIEKRNKDNWNIPFAVKNLCSTVLNILKTINV